MKTIVTLVGLKPTTLGLEIPCSIHLSYKAMKEGVFRRFYPYFKCYRNHSLSYQPLMVTHTARY